MEDIPGGVGFFSEITCEVRARRRHAVRQLSGFGVADVLVMGSLAKGIGRAFRVCVRARRGLGDCMGKAGDRVLGRGLPWGEAQGLGQRERWMRVRL